MWRDAVEDLADRIETGWRSVGGRSDRLPEVAARSLRDGVELDVDSAIDVVFGDSPLPPQRRMDQAFGEPAVTVSRREGFEIELLWWANGTPAIHEHAFSGAFCMIGGRSVHTRYAFESHIETDGVAIGALTATSVDLLQTADVVPIEPGDAFVHSAFHLDGPSVTLVVRSAPLPIPEPTYLPPGLRYDTARRSPKLHKALQMLDLLDKTQHPAYPTQVRAVLATADLHDAVEVLLRLGAHGLDRGTFLELAGTAEGLHGAAIWSRVVACALEERRRIRLIRMRHRAPDPDVRTVIAGLLSFTERRALITWIEGLYGPRAPQVLANAVATLLGGGAEQRIVAATGVEAWLEGVVPDAFPDWAARRWGQVLDAGQQQTLHRYYESLRTHELLHPLATHPIPPSEA